MKTQTNKRFLSKTFIAFAILLLAGSEMWGQNFIMNGTGASYEANCDAVIKINNNGGRIQWTNGATLGQTRADSIPGVVDWASPTPAAAADIDTVQALWYAHLVVSNGSKIMADGINVVGEACGTFLTGYDNIAEYPFYIASTDPVLFLGTFNYSAYGDQTIWPTYNSAGSNVNNYNILNIIAEGTVTLPNDERVGVNQLTGNGALTIEGNLYVLGAAADTSFYDGLVTVNQGGTINTTGEGGILFRNDITLQDSSAIVAGPGPVFIGDTATLALEGDNSYLNFGDGTDLVITGQITNGGNGSNLYFDCNSTVTYNDPDSGQVVLPTINVSTHRYGNLVLSGQDKVGGIIATAYPTADYADIYACGDFSLADGNLDMLINDGLLFLSSVDADVTYGAANGTDDNEEVLGRFGRNTDGTAGSYMFNNRQTFIALSTNANNPDSVELYVEPGAEPHDYNDTSDVKRKVTLNYFGNADDFAFDTVSVGYLQSERSDWTGVYTQDKIRFYESTDTPVDTSEKVGTGFPYNRVASTGTELGSVSLHDIQSTTVATISNGIDSVASGNDIVLRTGPTQFYTIADGRWTNPNIWDEGTIPTFADDAYLKHMVYVGIDGTFAGTIGGADDTPENNTKSEYDHYADIANGGNGDTAAANRIIILKDVANNPSLIIGNEDNPATYVFKTAYTDGSSIINNNTEVPTATFPIAAKTSFTDATGFNGLWVVPWLGATPTGRAATLGTHQIENKGKVRNEGIIEVGQ